MSNFIPEKVRQDRNIKDGYEPSFMIFTEMNNNDLTAFFHMHQNLSPFGMHIVFGGTIVIAHLENRL